MKVKNFWPEICWLKVATYSACLGLTFATWALLYWIVS